MSVKISYSNKTSKNLSGNIVLFVDEKFNNNNLKKYISNSELLYIKDLLKTNDLKKNIFIFDVNSKKRIILISIKKEIKSSNIENLGAEFYSRTDNRNKNEYFF